MKYLTAFLITIIVLISCTKKVARDPSLAYSNFAILDSIKLSANKYYKNDPNIVYPNTGAPHGPFKLRFNNIGFNALTSNGKLPAGGVMPNGSLVVKDVLDGNGAISVHAFMYKRAGSWIWGEIKPNKEVLYSVDRNPSLCINCHSQNVNIDLIRTFQYY